jgi:hypothetical protein
LMDIKNEKTLAISARMTRIVFYSKVIIPYL